MPYTPYMPPGDLWETEREKYIPPGDLWQLEQEAALKFPADKTNQRQSEPLPEGTDDRPLLVKLAARVVPEGRVKQRLDVTPWDKQKNYWNESIFDTRQDIIKDYMENTGSTFEEAMKWAKNYDEAHKTTPITNALEKYAIKKIFERNGVKRIN
jgi:hypothetical protein